jgi:carboxylesterase type B
MVAECTRVVQWVKDNIGRYNGDEDMIFLSGRFFLANTLLLLLSRRATLC